MTKSELQQSIEAKIKAEDIQPTAKWFFEAKNYSLWFLGGVALLVGSLAVAVTLDVLLSNDVAMARELGHDKMTLLLSTIPYLWIIAVIVFLFVAEREVRSTKHGYKYATVHIGGVLLFVTFVTGGVLYVVGVGAAADDAMAHKVPGYKEYMSRQHVLWSAPEQGRLAGVVAIVEDEEHFVLVDVRGDLWEVMAGDAKYPVPLTVSERMRLKLLGDQLQDMQFLAKVVMPFHKGPDIPKVMRYRHELQEKELEDFIRQSRERNFSADRNRE